MISAGRRDALGAILRSLATGVTLGALAGSRHTAFAQDEPVVAVTVRRFAFTPNEIELKAGQAVTLAFTSIDFIHGFNVPALGIRADLVPGRITRVRLPPMNAGRIDFLCDNFCGDGHEGMAGTLIIHD